MRTDDLLVLLRGVLLDAHATPVVLTPATSEPSITIDVDASDAAEAAQLLRDALPAGLTLPAVVCLTSGEDRVTVTARHLPGAVPVPDPRDGAAGSAASRAGVVAGRVALVTGGAQGFGEGIVRALHASGAWVFIADLNLDGATALAKELGERATAVGCNVADEDSVAHLAATIVATCGGIDLVVSNAGIARAGSVLEQDLAAFALSTDVNYTAFFLVTKHLGRVLRLQNVAAPDWATDIIQINSKSGLVGSNRNGAYAGSKFGGIGLVQSFALELVESRIKVNAICPGNFFDGPLWSDPVNGLFVQYLRSGKVPGATEVEEVRAFYESKVPMGRGALGADVMRALYYIVEQAYETGQAVPVTGGQVMLSS
ncbi:SDR family NAD(P)-dependent oxidoreductase [Tessaracoccus antarcticus]|uniref:SDR family NAD(P)-dependent oxidoreductase n=1 Tax=Tessaracoccus antarcticus TaxID=2479848 RepID=A0A3M0GAC1_9ACTN|nr:SDR family NAD(P)-dependent oxidoreductase [Tessaracoccus antarcticus]RMB61854.1 SDR family NAD(P)-dependent oxidoreductase [Tessaracoccus antarcticus]